VIEHRLYVGCIGEAVFRSLDNGATFRRAADGMFAECDVRALVVHPRRPQVLLLGSEEGVFLSEDGADNWRPLPGPVAGTQVWSILVATARPDRVVAGTCPPRLFVSEDGGESWREPNVGMQPDCPRIVHNRVTALASCPNEPDHLWAGVEIDGTYHSADGGRTWRPIGAGLSSRDIHAIACVPIGGGRTRLLAATNNDLNASEDGGVTWQPVGIGDRLPWPYTRALAQRADRPEVVLLGLGDGPPGSEGLIAISRDKGETWAPAEMPGRANSTIWNFATHPADPLLIYASSVSGQIYRSRDGGESWTKLAREFGEVRALAWAPG
jgi:photosystem II stability/assembly factor-like uncharacterized protein